MKKMMGMKRMREDGGIRGIRREEIIDDMEVDKERKGSSKSLYATTTMKGRRSNWPPWSLRDMP